MHACPLSSITIVDRRTNSVSATAVFCHHFISAATIPRIHIWGAAAQHALKRRKTLVICSAAVDRVWNRNGAALYSVHFDWAQRVWSLIPNQRNQLTCRNQPKMRIKNQSGCDWIVLLVCCRAYVMRRTWITKSWNCLVGFHNPFHSFQLLLSDATVFVPKNRTKFGHAIRKQTKHSLLTSRATGFLLLNLNLVYYFPHCPFSLFIKINISVFGFSHGKRYSFLRIAAGNSHSIFVGVMLGLNTANRREAFKWR